MSNYSKTYRVGLVGSGGIARAHGTACQALDGADLTAICDVSQDALDRYGEQFGVPNRYLNLDEMLEDANLDIAIICNWGAVPRRDRYSDCQVTTGARHPVRKAVYQ